MGIGSSRRSNEPEYIKNLMESSQNLLKKYKFIKRKNEKNFKRRRLYNYL